MAEITAAGLSTRKLQPEIVTIHLNLEHEGESREECVREVTQLHQQLVALFQDREAEGAITKFSAGNIRSGSYHRWVSGENQNVLTQFARSLITVTYQDMKKLSQDVAEQSENSQIRLSNFSWDIHDASRVTLNNELRREAVADALERAGLYAVAAGLEIVGVKRIVEPGLLAQGNDPGPMQPEMLRASASLKMDSVGGSSEGFDLVPPELSFDASIIVICEASPNQH